MVVEHRVAVGGMVVVMSEGETVIDLILLKRLAKVPVVRRGIIVESKVEKAGIIRHGAKMLHAVAEATVPKFTVILRKAYGAGYFVMNGKAFEPDLIVAWPTAEISVMGAEGAASILYHKQIRNSEDPKQELMEYANQFKELIDVKIAASNMLIDDVIDPADTKSELYYALVSSINKQVERPQKKNSIRPV